MIIGPVLKGNLTRSKTLQGQNKNFRSLIDLHLFLCSFMLFTFTAVPLVSLLQNLLLAKLVQTVGQGTLVQVLFLRVMLVRVKTPIQFKLLLFDLVAEHQL